MGVSKVEIMRDGNPETLIDLTNDTVEEEVVAEGVTFHSQDGEQKVGILKLVTVDSELNEESTNPVQNKVVAKRLNELSEEIVDYNEAILNIQTQDLQFVDSVEEMTDSKKNYVLKETGEIWSCQKVTKSYTNQILISTDADGNIFDEDGYKTDAYMSSSGSDSAKTGCVASGFIPYTVDKTLYYKGVDLTTTNEYTRMVFYNASKTAQGYVVQSSSLVDGHANALKTYFDITQVDDYYKMTPKQALIDKYSVTAFIRVSAGSGVTGDEWIMTVDEPIEEFTGYEFTPTGRYYGTESMQIVSSVEDMNDVSKKYVLEETGTIWYYGETSGEEEVSYTNLATTFKENYRLNSSGGETAADGVVVVMDYIEVKMGDIVRIKGLGDLTEFNTAYYLSDKTSISSAPANATGQSGYATYAYDSATGIVTLTIVKDTVSYVRVSERLDGTTEDVIITINEEIVEGNTKVPYTNQIPISTDADGNVVGLIKDYRYNSSDTLVANTGTDATGFIPVKFGDTVRFKNIKFATGDNNGGYYLRTYDEGSYTAKVSLSGLNTTVSGKNLGVYELDDNGELISFTFNNETNCANLAYIRMAFVPTDEEAIITVNEEIVEIDSDSDGSNTGVLSWKDSKIKYAGTGNEDTLVEVERRVTKTEINIKRLENKIDNIKVSDNSGTTEVVAGIPDYWKTAVDSMRDTILAQLDEGGHESFGFTWGADIHGKNGYTNPSNGAGTSVTKNIGHVCQYATEVYDLPFAMFSGDIMSQGSHSKEETVHTEHEDMMEIFSPINFYKLLIEKGNHDGAYGAPVDGVYYLYNIGGKELYNNLFRKQALDRTRVFGGDGSYFYVDTPNNMRVIMLNGHTTGDDSVDENGYAVYNSMKYGVYGNEQLNWLANEALNTDKRIILSAHQPFAQSMDGSILAGILNAYNNRTSYKGSKDVAAEYWGNGVSDNTYTMISIEKDFTNAKGKIIAYFHGHIHKDTIDNTTNTFIVASITTAGADVRDTNPPLRTAGTATETALDIVIITDKKIYFNRLGAGESREVAIK